MAIISKIRVLFSEIVAALGYTPENPANKGVANGYAGLDSGGTVPAAQLPVASASTTGALSSTDWSTFNGKQAALTGNGIVQSTNGTISYLTDNSANWNTAYNRSLISAAVTGTTTKTLTLNKQDGTTLTASWTDINANSVTSVFGRTGAVVATEGDYSLTQLSDVTLTSPANGQLLQNNGTAWVNWSPTYLTGNQVITLSGDVTGSGSTSITTTLANSGVTAGIYGSVTQVPQFTVDAKGRLTSVTNISLSTTFDDNVFTIQDNDKKLQFQVSGITPGTTRTLTAPDVNGTIITGGDSGTVTNTMLAGSIADTKLNIINTAGKVANSATTAASANTANAIVARDANGGFAATNVNLSGQLTITRANNTGTGLGQIYLNGAQSNRIDFNNNGVAGPAFTTRSVGTKVVLFSYISASSVDYALGIDSNTLWYSVPTVTAQHRFFTSTTSVARIKNDGMQIIANLYEGNDAFTALNTTATLTIAQILTMVIESTPTANITFTLPTGTNTDGGVMSSLETFASFTWSIVNIATGFTITMAGNTGNTYIGNTTIAANTSASFRTQKTAANTFKTVRI